MKREKIKRKLDMIHAGRNKRDIKQIEQIAVRNRLLLNGKRRRPNVFPNRTTINFTV
jgi:hypothetical protein